MSPFFIKPACRVRRAPQINECWVFLRIPAFAIFLGPSGVEMKRLIVGLLLLVSFPLVASHIVGGEIELLHLQQFRYRLNLIYYFDATNNPGRDPVREEPKVTLYIYRKSDNALISSVELAWDTKNRVQYTQPNCSKDGILSDKLVYTTELELPANVYGDPGGYYIMWPRCCRNYTISNIISTDPAHDGEPAGQTFYMEFPPVTVNGKQFINSSPKNFPSLGDYACPTRKYYVNFAGTDDDGDSLVYTLVTPLSTSSLAAAPDPTPAPYPNVKWRTGFSLDNIVNRGNPDPNFPDLRITKEGFLTVTPKELGLYVFAVKVEEYRNKKKIGEVRRDFQMLVVDCQPAVAPTISGKTQSAPDFTQGTISVSFANTVSDEDRYITVKISDKDGERAEDNFEEKISLRAIAIGFRTPANLSAILPDPSFGTIHHDETIEFRINFDACPYVNEPFQVGIIALDDACALPLMDTLKVNVQIEPPHNDPVKFNPPKAYTLTLNEGDDISLPFEAHDADNDDLLLIELPDGFVMASAGMSTSVSENTPGVLKGQFSWDAFCDIYDFTKQTEFKLKLLVDDLDKCDLNPPDVITYNLKVNLPPDNKPVIDTNLTSNPTEILVDLGDKKIFDRLSFNVTGEDLLDNDEITVRMVGDDFNPSDYGMSFDKKTAIGSVKSAFNWTIPCDTSMLAHHNVFNIAFLAVDSVGKCRVRQLDSLVVKVKVIPPDNAPPHLSILNLNDDVPFDGENALVIPGQKLELQLNVIDDDTAPMDNLTLILNDAGGDVVPEGSTFSTVTGQSVLSTVFSWEPSCTIFRDKVFEHNFYFEFRYSDDRCAVAKSDSIRINVKVKDRESENFDSEPANVFTPNGDGVNDFYSMERRNEAGDLINILPVDNCQGVFENIRIYNRWGRTVFSSSDRNFRWYGQNETAGVYFYHVAFSNRDFKGVVSLRD
jgi:hypothetical protein